MEGKKISFGFSKTKKADKPLIVEKRDFIECVEEKSIKVVGGEEVKENAPLVIALKPNTLITAERLQQIAEEVEKSVENELQTECITKNESEIKPPLNETLDQRAVRELLEESKKVKSVETKQTLTINVPAKSVVEGEKESTLEDYDSIPVQDFGLAMLRGMGWQPTKEQSKHKQPTLRPKGLGLGADKVVKENQKKNAKENNKDEDLSIIKNAFVKITSGRHSGYYGKVVSLDEDNGRVVIDISVKKETVSLSEFMMQPVTRSEFDKQSRVINADSFDDYKKKETVSHKSRQVSPKVEKEPSSSRTSDKREGNLSKEDRSRSKDYSNGKSRDRERHRRHSTSSEEKSRRREKKRYSSNESLSSSDRRTKHKSRRKCSSSDSDTDKKHKRNRSDGKRDIDKKRKGKKKKRDRDRSPNYRKHRK